MTGVISGEFPDTVKRDKGYFLIRHTWLDCRGPLEIHAQSHWGFYVKVITLSHDISKGVGAEHGIGDFAYRPVIVEKNAWIGSGALLYNCIIREGAVVAAGTVVRSCEVAPFRMVAGNPAEVIAWWDNGWRGAERKWRVLA